MKGLAPRQAPVAGSAEQSVVGQTSGLPVEGASGSPGTSAVQAEQTPTLSLRSKLKPSDQRSNPPATGNDGPLVPAPTRPSRLIAGLHSRGALPHLKREGASYFVTFRLAGTLPKEVLLRLKRERESIVAEACAHHRPLTWSEQRDLFDWYSAKVDAYLDAGHGDCWLRRPDVAKLVLDALQFFQGDRYDLHAWVVMPNHVHVVVHPRGSHPLSSILKSWKTYTALQANRLLNRTGHPFWQSESYDHCCRDQDDRARCCEYTLRNPVTAGLCADPRDWPWSSANIARTSVGQTSGLPVPGASGSRPGGSPGGQAAEPSALSLRSKLQPSDRRSNPPPRTLPDVPSHAELQTALQNIPVTNNLRAESNR